MSSDYWLQRERTSRVSRRRFVGGAASISLAAAAAGLVACGGGKNNSGAPSSAPTSGGAAGGTPAGTAGTAAAPPAGSPAAGTAAARPAGSPTAAAAASGATPAAADAASGAKPQEGSYYAVSGASTAFASVDVHRELYPNVEANLSLSYSNLVIYADATKGTIAPDVIAALPEQPDPPTYVFSIRPDVTWFDKPPANGRKLTADDVKWNMDRQIAHTDPKTGQQTNDFYRYSSIYKYVDKVEALDPTHVKVTLKQPHAPWLDAMCHVGNGLMLQEVVEKIDADLNHPDPNLIIGTGPYIYTAFEPGKQFIANRNPNYFAKKAGQPVQFFDQMRFFYLGLDVNPIRAAFVQKQIDSFGGSGQPYTKDYMDALQKQIPNSRPYQLPQPNANWTLAYSVVNPPFNNPKLAMAFHLAIDRQQVLQLYYQGEGRIEAQVPWAYGDWALSPDELEKLPGYRSDKTQDLKDARALWDAGGGPAVGTVQIVVNEGAGNVNVPEWFPAMMNKNLGISQVKADFLPLQSVLPHIAAADFNNLFCSWTAWDSADPRTRLAADVTPGGALNFPKFSSDDVTALVQKALAEFDIAKAKDLVHQVQVLCNQYAGAGKFNCAAGVSKFLYHGYLHMDLAPINYVSGLLARGWIDQKDPSFASRPKA